MDSSGDLDSSSFANPDENPIVDEYSNSVTDINRGAHEYTDGAPVYRIESGAHRLSHAVAKPDSNPCAHSCGNSCSDAYLHSVISTSPQSTDSGRSDSDGYFHAASDAHPDSHTVTSAHTTSYEHSYSYADC